MKLSAIFNRTMIAGLAVVAISVVTSGNSFAAESKGPKNSPALAKPLKDAHEDLNAHKYAEAITKLKAAEGTAGKTPGDQYLIDEMLSFAYIKTQN